MALFYVYILECADGTFYTGWTVDIEKRLLQHNRGKGAKYTRSRYPVVLKHCEASATKKEAMQREYQIKSLSKEEKTRIISDFASEKEEN